MKGGAFADTNARVAAFLLIVMSGVCWFLVQHGNWNIDEGFYLFSSRLVSEGLLPYRDFSFTQPPAILFANLPILELFGYDLMGIRLASAFWIIVTGIALTLTIYRVRGSRDALLFIALLLASVGWLVTAMKGRNYPLASLFVGAAMLITYLDMPPVRKWYWFVALAAGAMLTRYPAFFMLAPLSLKPLLEIEGNRRRIWHVLGAVVMAGVISFLISFGDWRAFWFWTVDYHLHSKVTTPRLFQIQEFYRLSPVVIPLFLYCLFLFRKPEVRKSEWIRALALIIPFTFNFYSTRTYGEYSSIFIPALCVFVTMTLGPVISSLRLRSFYLSIPAALLLSTVVYLTTESYVSVAMGTLQRALGAQYFLERVTEPGDQVSGSCLEVAVGTGRQIPSSLSMGVFSVSDTLTEEEIERYHLLSYDDLLDIFASPENRAIVFYTDHQGNFVWSVPTIEPFPMSYFEKLRVIVNEQYKMVYQDEDYSVLIRREGKSDEES